jgi:hypothetical protein
MGKADQSVQSTVNVGVAVQPTLTEADRMKLIEQREKRSLEHVQVVDGETVITQAEREQWVADNIKQK